MSVVVERIRALLLLVRRAGRYHWLVQPKALDGTSRKWPLQAHFPRGGPSVTVVTKPPAAVVYSCPTVLTVRDWNEVTVGDVYAILAGEGKHGFVGARLNFRDLLEVGRQQDAFLYVVSTTDVTDGDVFTGYVRLGPHRWIEIPAPRPQAVYNRIPNRELEGRPSAVRAKRILQQSGILMFNPSYFSKSTIYEFIRQAGLSDYLPETETGTDASSLLRMLHRHGSLYLKPSGGSVGHGMIRVDQTAAGYEVTVLKKGNTTRFSLTSEQEMWRTIVRERVPGRYVVQQAIPLIRHQGDPCDFRVLLQKRDSVWTMVGRGVRVCGPGRITTHVPSGGRIASADRVLQESFNLDATRVSEHLEAFTVRAAGVIDAAYQSELGEMSMDIGIDASGHPWFFEANAKPMKFDEPDIRAKSLDGILFQLRALARA